MYGTSIDGGWRIKREMLSTSYTTRWEICQNPSYKLKKRLFRVNSGGAVSFHSKSLGVMWDH
ncbi:DUF4113 domain-containing protein [Yersinia frederiksenii]|uniref:DUF4113 domain-containing protein n=1 Tax=Yersinia frederiksenii TaxID=29484 RepID=UPI003B01705C